MLSSTYLNSTASPSPFSCARRRKYKRSPHSELWGTVMSRWCPRHSPSRAQDCCFRSGETVGFPFYTAEGYPPGHDSTHFGAPSRGLPPSLQLRPPITGGSVTKRLLSS